MLSIVVMALVLLTGAPVAAAQALGKATATLTGDTEVPGPGDPKSSGTVEITLDPAKGDVCDELRVANMQEATAAHIHEGAKGQKNPVRANLANIPVTYMAGSADLMRIYHTAVWRVRHKRGAKMVVLGLSPHSRQNSRLHRGEENLPLQPVELGAVVP